MLAIIRIVPELERSGDLAEHIAKRAGSGLATQLTPTARGMIERMGTVTVELWRRPPTGSSTATPRPAPAWRRPTTRWTTSTRRSTTELLSGDVPSPIAADATLDRALLRAPRRPRRAHRPARVERHRLTARSIVRRGRLCAMAAAPRSSSNPALSDEAFAPRHRAGRRLGGGDPPAGRGRRPRLPPRTGGGHRHDERAGHRLGHRCPPGPRGGGRRVRLEQRRGHRGVRALPGLAVPPPVRSGGRGLRDDLQAGPGPLHRPRVRPPRRRGPRGHLGPLRRRVERHRAPGGLPHHRRVRGDALPLRHPDHQGHRQAPHGHHRRHRRRSSSSTSSTWS